MSSGRQISQTRTTQVTNGMNKCFQDSATGLLHKNQQAPANIIPGTGPGGITLGHHCSVLFKDQGRLKSLKSLHLHHLETNTDFGQAGFPRAELVAVGTSASSLTQA
ncbi:hypothetical protein VTO42DRAFT_489 [Malbranchea cinnamomea]